MGLEYQYRLQFRRGELQDVLLAVAEFASPVSDTPLKVIFPDRTLALPFTSQFKTDPLVYDPSRRYLCFDTSLFFAQDDPLRRYFDQMRLEGDEPKTDDKRRVAFGYIYLTVRLALDEPELISFDFEPATSVMSIVFAESESIRRTFVQLLEEHEGVLGKFADSDCNWGPIVIWPENSPDYNPENLLMLHETLSPNTPYYRKYRNR